MCDGSVSVEQPSGSLATFAASSARKSFVASSCRQSAPAAKYRVPVAPCRLDAAAAGHTAAGRGTRGAEYAAGGVNADAANAIVVTGAARASFVMTWMHAAAMPPVRTAAAVIKDAMVTVVVVRAV